MSSKGDLPSMVVVVLMLMLGENVEAWFQCVVESAPQ